MTDRVKFIHWDEAITRIGNVQWLPVIISSNRQDHLLGVPQLSSSTADDLAAAVHKVLDDNHLL